jgi:Transposase DDE domain group 1
VSPILREKLQERKRRISERLGRRPASGTGKPVLSGGNIHYEISDRVHAIAPGGLGAVHLMAQKIGLVDGINKNVHVLKRHVPYRESDHILNIALNIMAGGKRLEHIELLRNDEVYLDALGAERIPDPTTEGDFCRRFNEFHIQLLMDAINEARLRVWKQQPPEFFDEAVIDVDGTIAPTDSWCKEGIDIAYNGQWGYHPLLVSLANTGEPLYLVNRSGNRPSQEDAHQYIDRTVALCRKAGFRLITLRGDTKFSQTTYVDGWNQPDIRFLFGMDSMPNLVELAGNLPVEDFELLERPIGYEIKTAPRQRRPRVRAEIVKRRRFKNTETYEEAVAEFPYCPGACKEPYRMIVLRKRLIVTEGQMYLFEEYRYFFFITNDWSKPATELVLEANQRCDQENLIAQLKGGVGAMTMPVDTLESNWAYMVMAGLAWSLKAWVALLMPVESVGSMEQKTEKRKLLRIEFATFRAAVIQIPCQIVRTAGRLVFRLLSWNPWQASILRLVDWLHTCRLC